MDSKELRGLMEAYSEVYAPQEEIDEAVKGESSERRRDLAAQRRAGDKPLSPSKGKHNAAKMQRDIDYFDKITKKTKPSVVGMTHEEYVDEATAMAKRGLNEPAIRQQIASSTGGGQSADRAGALADRPTYGQSGTDPKARANYARKQMGDFRKTNSSNPGLHGYGHKSNDPDVKAKQAARGAQRGSATLTPNEKKKLNMGEAVDLFDTILEFLYVEGYAETLEEAEWLMANVIDEEAIDIVIGEAQVANRDPDKYEREQRKKSAPVRGEKTPMPPRGDKRREDFEKWYAANGPK
jgi:hypothetical protein